MQGVLGARRVIPLTVLCLAIGLYGQRALYRADSAPAAAVSGGPLAADPARVGGAWIGPMPSSISPKASSG
jgi:hypothetical protein